MSKFIAATVLVASLPAAVLAAPDDTIVVTASRVEQAAASSGHAITVLDRATIVARQTISVADLIATTPGVTAVRNGGYGGVTGVFVRGAAPDQTLVLIDGVRVNDPSSPSGSFDFGNLQIGGIDRIEVLRGANSVLWGSQALGGVIDIVTRAPTDTVTLTASGEYGDRETGQASANISGGFGPVRASLGGSWFSTAGISATTDDNERDASDQRQANGRVEVTIAEAMIVDLRGFYARSYVELDGFNPTGVNRLASGYVGAHGKLGTIGYRIAYSLADTRRTTTSAFGDARFDGRSERVEAQGDWQAAPWLQIIAGGESEWSRANNSFLASPQRTRLSSVYGQLLIEPIAGLNLAGGARYDDHRSFGGAATVGANAAWTVSNTVLRASFAQGFKAPALDQLFADYGNTALIPERADSIDGGIEQRLLGDRVRMRVTAFDRRTRDLIVFFNCSSDPSPLCAGRGEFGAYYRNIARASARGVEGELVVRPDQALTLTANYTHLLARDRSVATPRDLPRRPRETVNANVDWARGPLALGASVALVGDSFDDAANSVRLDGYVLAGVRASLRITPALSIYGRVDNLFDERYEVATGFNTIGRNAAVGVRLGR